MIKTPGIGRLIFQARPTRAARIALSFWLITWAIRERKLLKRRAVYPEAARRRGMQKAD